MKIQVLKSRLMGGFQEVIQYVKVHKTKAIASLGVVALLVAGSIIGDKIYQSNLVDIYHVFLHGEEIGTVSSPQVVEDWLTQKELTEKSQYEGFHLEIDKDISYKLEKVYKGTYNNEATLESLSNSVQVKAKAFKLVVDGEFIGYVKDQQSGEAILNAIKSKYTNGYVIDDKRNTVAVANLSANKPDSTPSKSDNSETLKEVKVKENVQFVPTIIKPEEMTDEATIEAILQKGVVEEKTYTIQPGDCLGCVASKFGLKIADLKRLNPGLDEDTVLQIGQVINVTALDPKLTVQTVFEKSETEKIPYKTEYVEDKNIYKGETRVKQKGVAGEKIVTYEILKENGIEVSRTATDEEVLKDPTNEIVIKGTKPLPIVATGKFMWPTKGGYITSSFGYRWGKLHTGMDISGVKDKTIMAADNGKVTFAGWKGNYGNAIVIDHGGGYQTLYGHLSKISVKKGQQVAKGQKIGVMGNTGNSTGTHLHFEIIKNGKQINPAKAFNK